MNVTKDSHKMKNKRFWSIENKLQNEKMPYYNYKKIF